MARPGVRGLILPAALTLAALLVLVSLGNWQVRRLAWKEDLIARTIARPKSEPLDFRQTGFSAMGDVTAFLDANDYRRVRLAGEYQPAGEVRVFTSLQEPKNGPFSGPGFWIMTPFATRPSKAAIYINRGFVPQDKADAYDPPPTGEVEIEGLMRAPERGSYFTPDPDLQKRIFYARDPLRMAEGTGLAGGTLALYVDLAASETPPSGLPQAGETMVTFTNNHLQYAVTWYGLAAALLAVFAAFAAERLRKRDNKPA
jgi:surfeit locus 1 family protein